jgi:hypothetical protein
MFAILGRLLRRLGRSRAPDVGQGSGLHGDVAGPVASRADDSQGSRRWRIHRGPVGNPKVIATPVLRRLWTSGWWY